MKTDPLFYELFRCYPSSLSELTGLEVDGDYVFESITVKSTEKRLDGFFRRKDGESPDIFLEVQGYDDPNIYWRLFQEIFIYYAQADKKTPFTAVFIFTDTKYDPGDCPVEKFAEPNCMIIRYLPDCLKLLKDKASPLTVLKPLILESKKQLPEAVPKWKSEIASLKLPERTADTLIELLENAILSRFPKMTLEEIQDMIRLTPLEKTVAGQELIRMGFDDGILKGRIEGIQKGIEKGKLIGKIHLAQRLLKYRSTPKKKLTELSMKELRVILKKLEAELKNI
jgi:predicted transposase YdaD